MVGIKDFEMSSCCGNCQMASCKGLSGQFYCDITTYDVDMDDTERDADCPLVEAISKADYENRLKADMVAMLEDIKKEMNPIKECEYQIYGKENWRFAGKCQDVIQQKINLLKEPTDDKDKN